MKAVIRKIELPDEGRIIAISDVHANLPYLKGLLEKLRLRDKDTLVFCGDLLEKGAYSLETLRFVMELQKRRRVLAVQGNCDCWQNSIYRATGRSDVYTKRYLLSDSAKNVTAFYAAFAAYSAKDYANTIKYGNMALNSPNESDVNTTYEIMTRAYREQKDTVNWIRMLQEGIKRNPASENNMVQLINYYSEKGQNDEAVKFADQLIAKMSIGVGGLRPESTFMGVIEASA